MRRIIAVATLLVLPATIVSADQRADALRALQALRAVTEAGATYSIYASRVTDASIVVDRYRRGDQTDRPPRKALLLLAMRYYVLALRFWSIEITRNADGELVQDRDVLACMPGLLDEGRKQGWDADVISMRINWKNLWSCANAALSKYEREVGTR